MWEPDGLAKDACGPGRLRKRKDTGGELARMELRCFGVWMLSQPLECLELWEVGVGERLFAFFFLISGLQACESGVPDISWMISMGAGEFGVFFFPPGFVGLNEVWGLRVWSFFGPSNNFKHGW